MRVVVAGGGIVGLWTAYVLAGRGHSVTVIRRGGYDQTTSAAAVCVLTPFFPGDPSTPTFQTGLTWAEQTLAKVKELEPPDNPFLERIPCFEFGFGDHLEADFPVSKLAHLTFSEFRRVDLAEVIDDCDFAIGFDCYLANTMVLLPLLDAEVRRRGVRIVESVIDDIDQLMALDVDVVVNCLGFNSIFPDPDLYPVLGQSMFIPESHPDERFGLGAGHHAVFRHRRGYYLGSYFMKNEFAVSPREDLYRQSLEFVRGPFPDLCRSVGIEPPKIDLDGVARVSAGVRPYRPQGPRVELDNSYPKPVVHNYAHGAHGWTVGYGSAIAASNIVEESY